MKREKKGNQLYIASSQIVVQKFALNQIELDEEFTAALDKLFISKINSGPTKRRF